MATHDYSIADQTGASFRTDLNNVLAAIVSNNSNTVEPTAPFAYMWWADTTTGILKQRNSTNLAWLSILTLASGEPIGYGLKAPLASPTFTGTPAGPTPSTGTDSTQLATTAYVKAQGRASEGANSDITSLTGLTTDLAVIHGGTGVGTHTDRGVLIGRGTGDIVATAAGTAGQFLQSSGPGVDPVYATVDTSPASASIGKSELKTSLQSISTTTNTQVVATGGDYCFAIQGYDNQNSLSWEGANALIDGYSSKDASIFTRIAYNKYSASYRGLLTLAKGGGSNSIYMRQRYVTASPPYNLGHSDIPLFIFATVDKNGDVVSTSISDTPPWIYNGETQAWADAYGKNGEQLIKKKVNKDIFVNKFKSEKDMEIYQEAKSLVKDKYEVITHAIKNADMDSIPQPFTSATNSETIVVLDPLSPITQTLADLMVDGENVNEILLDNLKVGNVALDAGFHPSVMTVGVSWK